MFIAELFNGAPKQVSAPEQTYVEDSGPQLVVLYPGRFQPFHLGHSDVFNSLQSKFGRGNVYISTSNKTEEGRSPFNFSDKLVFMTAAGVPVDRVLENTSPYKLPPQFDPANTILVVAVGAPDDDRLRPGSYKKDGQPGYYQKFESIEKCTTSDKHGYVIVAAERKKVVTIGGKQYDASHGTTVRNLWNAIRNKPQQRAEFITQMFGRNDPEVGRVLDKIDLSEAAGEVALPVDSISPIHGGINESADDPFAPSSRVFNQVQQDRHPLNDYLTFEDYDMLMDEFADTQSAVKNDSELDAYLEKFESGVKSAGIPQVVVDIVEEFVHGRHGKYGTEVPRRNQALLADLNKAFGQIWIQFKPDRFAQTLARHMSLACVAAISAEDQDEFYESDDDMFATARHSPRSRIISFLEDADSYQQDGDNYSAIECLEQADVYQQQLGHDKNPRMEDMHIMITRIIESIDGGNTDSYEIHTNIDDVIEYFEYDMIDESNDDLFAMTKAQKVSQGLRGYAAELKSDIDSAHPTWGDSEQHQRETAKLEFVLFLANNFNNASKVPYTLNYIARVLNGDSRVVEYFKRHAIWDADDYLKEKIGYGFAELFSEYEGQIDEDDSSDDAFSGPRIELYVRYLLAETEMGEVYETFDARKVSEDEARVIAQQMANYKGFDIALLKCHGKRKYKTIDNIWWEDEINLGVFHPQTLTGAEYPRIPRVNESDNDMFSGDRKNSLDRLFIEIRDLIYNATDLVDWGHPQECSKWVPFMPVSDSEKQSILAQIKHGTWDIDVEPNNKIAGTAEHTVRDALDPIYDAAKAKDVSLTRHLLANALANPNLRKILEFVSEDPIDDLVQFANTNLSEDDDDMFADSKRVKVIRSIVADLEYLSNEMITNTEGFIEERGWYDELSDSAMEDVVDEATDAGQAFARLGEIFKTDGLDAGLNQLFQLYHHTNNQIVEWIADETIDALAHDYEVDMSRFNVNEDEESNDEMFSKSSPFWVYQVVGPDGQVLGTENNDGNFRSAREAEAYARSRIPGYVKSAWTLPDDVMTIHRIPSKRNALAYKKWNSSRSANVRYSNKEFILKQFQMSDYENVNEDDDMFSAPGKVAGAAKRNITGKIAAKARANRASDRELQDIVTVAKSVYGKPYSTGTIGGGKVYRLSFEAPGMGGRYRYSRLDLVSTDDRIKVNQLKGKLFDLLKQKGLDASRVDIKYHIGSGLYVSVRIKMKGVA